MSQEQQQQQLQRLTDQVQMLTAELATQRLDLDAAKSALEQQTQTATAALSVAQTAVAQLGQSETRKRILNPKLVNPPDPFQGTDSEFVAASARATLQSHAHLLQEIAALPDLQSAWLLLSFCAAPRAQHLLRTLPPAASATFAVAHDAAMWDTLQGLLGEAGAASPAWQVARHVAFLPTQLGGLGLVAAERTAPAAYWAAWADALPVLRQRYSDAAARCVRELAVGDEAAAPCLRAAAAAATHLHSHGWTACPTWHALFHALQPDAASADLSGPGLGPGGWQRQASLVLDQSFRESELLPALSPASRAMLRSQAGPQAAAWLTAIPSEPGTTLPPHFMHRALRRRLRLPLPLARARCGGDGARGCGQPLDLLGDHCAACPRSGALPRRAHVLGARCPSRN